MKKTFITLLAASTLMLSSCLTTGMGTAPTANQNTNVLGNVLGAVLGQVLLGGMTFDQTGLLGSWNYNAPSAAFTTQQALTKAEVLPRLPTSLRRWQTITATSVSTETTHLSRSLPATSSRPR